MNEVPRALWDLAGVIHNAKMELCYGKKWSPEYRSKWPEYRDSGHFMHADNRQPFVDIALEQAKAVQKNLSVAQ